MKDIHILPICVGYEKMKDVDIYERFPIDKDRFNVIIDTESPDYLIVTISHIISRDRLIELFRSCYSQDKIMIFEGDEAISPDLNIFDYAITYDDNLICDDRVCHRPFSVFVAGGREAKNNIRLTREEAEYEYDKRKFCNFIYSNSNSFHVRDDLFYLISDYKRVDSLGKHLNNVNNNPDRDSNAWFGSSVDLKKGYRFSISAENGMMRGYTSEKIVSSFLANSIPIYWGNPNISTEFNPDAFIDCNVYSSLIDVVNQVKKVEENRELWINMVTAPIMTDKQKEINAIQEKKYIDFINHIFEQDIKYAKRCSTTTASIYYMNRLIKKK